MFENYGSFNIFFIICTYIQNYTNPIEFSNLNRPHGYYTQEERYQGSFNK